MSQRSGLPDHSLDGFIMLHYPASRILRGARFVKPVSSFRSAFAYQNVFFIAAGKITEQVFGGAWPDLAAEKIFNPLGMTRTSAGTVTAREQTNVARGHISLEDGSLFAIPDNWPYLDFLDIYVTAGRIRSTVLDMSQWIRLQLGRGMFNGKRLISEENLVATWLPRILMSFQNGESASYANGWVYQSRSPAPYLWHSGVTLGMHSIVGLVPSANPGIAANAMGGDVPENLRSKLYELYYETAAMRHIEADARPVFDHSWRLNGRSVGEARVKAARLWRLLGTYRNPAAGNFRVLRRGRNLVLQIGPKKMLGMLAPKDGGTFYLYLPELPEAFGEVQFLPAGAKRAGHP